jgi:hypothetical protein
MFKSRIAELILRYKPHIIRLLMPDFQVVSLGELNPYMGRFPNDKLLALPSNVVRHVQGIERVLSVLVMRFHFPLRSFLVKSK